MLHVRIMIWLILFDKNRLRNVLNILFKIVEIFYTLIKLLWLLIQVISSTELPQRAGTLQCWEDPEHNTTAAGSCPLRAGQARLSEMPAEFCVESSWRGLGFPSAHMLKQIAVEFKITSAFFVILCVNLSIFTTR